LFALCLAMAAGNALAVVKRALTETHGAAVWDRLSGYYLADELATNSRAVVSLVGAAGLSRLAGMPAASFWRWCREVASRVEVAVLEKTKPRGPKRPQPKRQSGKGKPHWPGDSNSRSVECQQLPVTHRR
jgi:hypothetical protein